MACWKCKSSGYYPLGEHTLVACRECCQHRIGYWQMKKHYGNKNGWWCCGFCGKIEKEKPEGAKEILPMIRNGK